MEGINQTGNEQTKLWCFRLEIPEQRIDDRVGSLTVAAPTKLGVTMLVYLGGQESRFRFSYAYNISTRKTLFSDGRELKSLKYNFSIWKIGCYIYLMRFTTSYSKK